MLMLMMLMMLLMLLSAMVITSKLSFPHFFFSSQLSVCSNSIKISNTI